jgi:hypothetical protein
MLPRLPLFTGINGFGIAAEWHGCRAVLRGDRRGFFLRRYSLDRLPNDPKLRRRAAEFLRKQGKEDLARELESRGQ